MEEQLNRPKRFTLILDTIFSLSRSRFKEFFKVYLFLMGPVILLELILLYFHGKSLIRDSSSVGFNWIEWMDKVFSEENTIFTQGKLSNNIIVILMSFFGIFAQFAILYAIDHIRKEETFKVSEIIKRPFSRFLPVIGLTILLIIFFIGLFVLIFISIAILSFTIGSLSTEIEILLTILFTVAFIVLILYIAIRLSFIPAEIAFGNSISESIQHSWRITKGHTLFLFGLYLIFIMIIQIIDNTFQAGLGMILGDSILFALLFNIILLVTQMFGAVAYAVVYFDIQARYNAPDLQTMIEEYKNN